MKRFEALDSWRGIAACMVALYHLPADSHIYEAPFLRHSYLFVDFFFVLSGFVIAANYQDRLANGFGVFKFMVLRAGRLYPLHLALLVAYIGYELLKGSPHLPESLIANVTMSQNYTVFGHILPMNFPSWSIAVEFWTYLLFAVAVVILRNRILMPMLLVMGLCAATLYFVNGSIDDMHDFALLRCIYGFGTGVLCFAIYRSCAFTTGSVCELITAAVVVTFIVVGDRTWVSMLAPAVFAVAVLVFAKQDGAVSQFLSKSPFLFLGAVSYSIYMVHAFIAARFGTVAHLLGVQRWQIIGLEQWQGDLAYCLYIPTVLVVAWLTHRYIEMPGREWARVSVTTLPSFPRTSPRA